MIERREKKRKEKKKKSLSPRHLNLGGPSLPGQILHDVVEQRARPVHVGEDALDRAEEGLDLGALGLDVVEELRVLGLHRLQPGVELGLLRC
jgi:hypothetical protein